MNKNYQKQLVRRTLEKLTKSQNNKQKLFHYLEKEKTSPTQSFYENKQDQRVWEYGHLSQKSRNLRKRINQCQRSQI
jgi:hypothetical protein